MCLLRNKTKLKHTLHTSLLRGMVQNLHSKSPSFRKALFFSSEQRAKRSADPFIARSVLTVRRFYNE